MRQPSPSSIDPESRYHKPVFACGKSFVFFCNGAWRSALAADTAQQIGLEPVSEMDGGFTAWKNAGYPVEQRQGKKSSYFPPTTREPSPW